MIGNQNSTENLRLLAAQRQLYIEAKNIGGIRFFGSLAFVIVGPALNSYCADTRIWFFWGSTLWTIVAAIVLKAWQKEKNSDAATIQEEFDTALFGLEWNQILVGNKISKEIISEADRQFKGDRAKLIDWYPDVGQSRYPLDVLLCQRASLAWDWRLRRKYAWMLIMIIIIFLGIEVAILRHKTLLDFMTQYFVPALSLILIGHENIIANFEIAKKKERVEKIVTAIFEKCDAGACEVSLDKDCRQIQDFIYSSRTQNVIVPDFWYRFYRVLFQNAMQDAAQEYQKKNIK